jgi:hypothetical protein
LSQLLPDSAGSIYPLLEGEGLAEATHLWGQHAADTRPHGERRGCQCMLDQRVHLGRGDLAETVCAHVVGERQRVQFRLHPAHHAGRLAGLAVPELAGIGRCPS